MSEEERENVRNENEELAMNWKSWSGCIVEVLDESDEMIGGGGPQDVHTTEILKRFELLAMPGSRICH